MIRKSSTVIVILFLLVTLMPSSGAASIGAGQVQLTFLKPDGRPMVAARVKVYLWPLDPPTHFVPALLAEGRTDSQGVYTATLDTSLVTANPYNAEVLATDPGHHWLAISDVVLDASTPYIGSVTANTDLSFVPGAGKASDDDLTTTESVDLEPSSDPDGGDPWASRLHTDPMAPAPPKAPNVLADTVRQVKVLAWNVSAGMKSTFTYAASTETSTSTVISLAGGGWALGGMAAEETTRGAWASPSPITGDYHQIRYAGYRFYKYLVCLRAYCYAKWVPHNWTGDLSQVASFTQAPFVLAYAQKLVGPSGRSSGTKNVYGYSFTLEAVTGSSTSTYDAHTSVTWAPLASGCSTQQWLYGSGQDWTVAPIVYTACRTT